MKKSTKIFIIIALSLVVLGCIIFASVMSILSWDFYKLSSDEYVTNTYDVTKPFDSIVINSKTSDISIEKSIDSKCKVICFTQENIKNSVQVENSVLTINTEENLNLKDNFGVNFSNAKITVYLPQTEYSALTIVNTTGDIEVAQGFSFKSAEISHSTGDVSFMSDVKESVSIKASTGDVRLKDFTANAVDINVSTGEIKAENVIVNEEFTTDSSSGDVSLDSCDAKEFNIKTTTGDISGSVLSEKVFVAETNTGDVNVPQTLTGGKCYLSTTTGDINIKILN